MSTSERKLLSHIRKKEIEKRRKNGRVLENSNVIKVNK